MNSDTTTTTARTVDLVIRTAVHPITADVLTRAFRTIGELEGIEVSAPRTEADDTVVSATIMFRDVEAATRALNSLQGRAIYPSSCYLELRPAMRALDPAHRTDASATTMTSSATTTAAVKAPEQEQQHQHQRISAEARPFTAATATWTPVPQGHQQQFAAVLAHQQHQQQQYVMPPGYGAMYAAAAATAPHPGAPIYFGGGGGAAGGGAAGILVSSNPGGGFFPGFIPTFALGAATAGGAGAPPPPGSVFAFPHQHHHGVFLEQPQQPRVVTATAAVGGDRTALASFVGSAPFVSSASSAAEAAAAAAGQLHAPVLLIGNVPAWVPLRKLYTLLECYGIVTGLRRQAKHAEMVVAKFESSSEAMSAMRLLNQSRFYGAELTVRHFVGYIDRGSFSPVPGTCADPDDPACMSCDFTTARHRGRPHGHGGVTGKKYPPSENLFVANLTEDMTDDDVRGIFRDKGFEVLELSRKNPQFCVVSLADTDTAIDALVTIHSIIFKDRYIRITFSGFPPHPLSGEECEARRKKLSAASAAAAQSRIAAQQLHQQQQQAQLLQMQLQQMYPAQQQQQQPHQLLQQHTQPTYTVVTGAAPAAAAAAVAATSTAGT